MAGEGVLRRAGRDLTPGDGQLPAYRHITSRHGGRGSSTNTCPVPQLTVTGTLVSGDLRGLCYRDSQYTEGRRGATDPRLGAGQSLLHGQLEAAAVVVPVVLLLPALLLVPVPLHGTLQLRLLTDQVLTAVDRRTGGQGLHQ